jgi:hypothetical protein
VQLATSLTIPAGEYLSDGVDAAGVQILRLVTPVEWPGKGVPLSFQLSYDGGATWGDLHNAESGQGAFNSHEVVARVAAGVIITMPANTGFGVSWLRLRFGSRGVPVAQKADQVFQIVQEATSA